MGGASHTLRWWRRPPVRLSVRALMAIVLVLGGGLGWVIHRAQVQREAVAGIRQADGSVIYYHQSRSRSSGMPWWQRWAAEILGIDYFDDVMSVFLEFKESDLKQ